MPRIRLVALIGLGLLTSVQPAYGETELVAEATGDGEVSFTSIADVATLNGDDPQGTIRFKVFGPGDPGCAGQPADESTVLVNGDGVYTSEEVTPYSVGTYRWRAEYSGDPNNPAVSVGCNALQQSVEVSRVRTTLAATASGAVETGGQIHDAARLTRTHEFRASGTITFQLFGPSDPSCASPVSESVIALDSSRRAVSAPFAPSAAGRYRWIATYSGDPDHEPVSGLCGDAGQSVDVAERATPTPTALAPTLALRPLAGVVRGDDLRAAVDLATPGTGTLTFRWYGPNDAACAGGAVAASSRRVLGSGTYIADPFTPPAAGAYVVTVHYAGDDGAQMATSCADPSALVAVFTPGAPRPVLNETFNLERVTGTVLVQVAATPARVRVLQRRPLGFIEVTEPRTLPVGSVVDTRAGRARVTTAAGPVRFQSGEFAGARFKVRQPSSALTELQLSLGTTRNRVCRTGRRARAAGRRRLPKTVIDSLNSKATGKFRTRGKYASASVEGTVWRITERCDGTLTEVRSGAVSVTDLRRRRTVSLTAGRKLLVRAP